MSTTENLTGILKSTSPEDLTAFFEKHWASIISDEKPFAAYMRAVLKAKGIRQTEDFIRADVPEHYGYRLISEERHTKQRDVILRLCIGGRLSLEETQKALTLYGLLPLYARSPRDAVIMVAINNEMDSVHDVDGLLERHGMQPLETCGATD